MSNGELLIILNIVRNGSLWSNVNIWIWFRDLRIRFWGPEIKHPKAHNFVWQGFFFFHYYLATLAINWVQIFTCLLFCACWDTPSEKTGLWQLPIVSSVFKGVMNFLNDGEGKMRLDASCDKTQLPCLQLEAHRLVDILCWVFKKGHTLSSTGLRY